MFYNLVNGRAKAIAPAVIGAALLAACQVDTESPGTVVATGGSTAGGSTATGGTAATGTGGTFAGTGGAKASTGGATGGTSTGGVPATGGRSMAGGAAGTTGLGTGGSATGGASAGGGTVSGGSGGGPVAGKAGSAGSGGSAAGAGGSAGGGGGGGADVGKSAGCGKTRTLMNGRKTIQSGGNREYILRVPDNYDNTRPYRLIIAYHWLNGNANQVANGGEGGSTEDPYYGLWDLAENSTIFVAPEGLNAGWANSGGADVTLTDAILAQVQGDLCIDTTRIFATGFSYGGGMSYAIACARADIFRGVALYAGAQLSGCSGGTTPIAYFHAHGISDSVLNISQGRTLRDKFVGVNGCMSQSPPEPARGSGTHTCTSYQGCSPGHPVRWCAFDGDHNPTQKDQGQNKSWIPGEVWEFFSQF